MKKWHYKLHEQFRLLCCAANGAEVIYFTFTKLINKVNLNGRWNYIRAAFSAVHPFGFADPLVVRGHVVKTRVEMENKHQVSNSANYSLKKQRRIRSQWFITVVLNQGFGAKQQQNGNLEPNSEWKCFQFLHSWFHWGSKQNLYLNMKNYSAIKLK